MRRADGNPINVLVVDDEPVLAEMVSMALRYEGWNIATAGDGASALESARSQRPDVVVLDVMLPDMSGLDVLRKLREETPQLPVLLLTAKDAVEDRIAGLTAGGDDYVTKPFSLEEVVLRLRALLRRTGVTTEDSGAQLVVGDLVLNEDSHDVTRAGEPISLTSTEFELLRFMMRNSKRVLSKAQILDRVWSYDFGGRSNIVELYISYLRKKDRQRARAHDSHASRRRLRPQAGTLAMGGAWSLRFRLLVGQVVVLAVVCIGIGAATELALYRYLVAQLDTQLRDASQRSVRIIGEPPTAPWRHHQRTFPRPGPGPVFLDAPGQPVGMVAAVTSQGGATEAGYLTTAGSRAALTDAARR